MTPSLMAGFSSALKLRKYLTRHLDKFADDNTSAIEVDDFHAIEKIIER